MARSRSHTRRAARLNPRGILSVRRGGFGFVQTPEGEFFIPRSKMAGAFDGDLVELAPVPARKEQGKQAKNRLHKTPAARVLRVIERAHDTLIGRYETLEPFGVVVPEDSRIPYDIFTMRSDYPGIEDGSLVRVRITAFPSRNTSAMGVIEEVLGRADNTSGPINAVIARHKLETAFSDDALTQARQAAENTEAALGEGYSDIRDRFVFTIDPSDARDFDDALSLARVCADDLSQEAPLPCGSGIRWVDGRARQTLCWRVGVHIADVSYYVPKNTPLDRDARQRATSVYLVDRTLPMLPEELSNNLCSLMPHATRRTMTADLYLDSDARLVAYNLYPALIRSRKRLSYDEVQEMLDGAPGGVSAGASADALDDISAGVFDGPLKNWDGGLTWQLAVLSHIAKCRLAARVAAGGLEFDTTEAHVQLDEDGAPVAIKLRRKTDATSLVEEAMILANEVVATHLLNEGIPSLYRVHARPSPMDLADLISALREFPWFRAIDQNALVAGDARTLQQLLSLSAARPEKELVSSLVLRSMKRAVYAAACGIHFGLASDAYTHFTSPIRRYPDLVVHRALKGSFKKARRISDKATSELFEIAEHSSVMERVAEKAARESQEIKIIEYLQACIGQTFSAIVSGVASYGLYVRLDNTAEGIIRLKHKELGHFELDEKRHCLANRETGTSYRLGQRVAVVLTAADPYARRLEFCFAQ